MAIEISTAYRSAIFRKGRPFGIKSITIHHWGVDGQRHDNVCKYLCRKGGNTSAHYVVSDGRINQLVDDTNRAFHTGHGLNTPRGGNATSIGIECRPEMSADDFAATAQLVARLRRIHGDLPLVGHVDWKSTGCPGRWYKQLDRLDAAARAWNDNNGASIASVAEDRIIMGYTHITFAANRKLYVANMITGTYQHMRNMDEFNFRVHWLKKAGWKVASYADIGGPKNSVTTVPAIFGREI